jgi:hypothetical protein
MRGDGDAARLLLHSGLNNEQIGRNVMFHMQTFVFGIMSFRVQEHIGRSVTHGGQHPAPQTQQDARFFRPPAGTSVNSEATPPAGEKYTASVPRRGRVRPCRQVIRYLIVYLAPCAAGFSR